MTLKIIELFLHKEHKVLASYAEAGDPKLTTLGGPLYLRKVTLPTPLPQSLKLTLETLP